MGGVLWVVRGGRLGGWCWRGRSLGGYVGKAAVGDETDV